MKNSYLIILSLITFITSFSQEIPTIKTDKSTLGLQKLNIKVEVIGNIATTTYDMLFYNPENRVLEGELSFPLGQNQSVTKFALDLNGNLRNAVIVEKELGRVAYESTIRQKIDPALLEQTKGNNYKARIYPIPAKGTKRIVLSFQQELTSNKKQHQYHLPLNFKKKLDVFNLKFTVLRQSTIPIITTEYKDDLEFKKWNENYTLTFNKNNFIPNKVINIAIPNSLEEEKIITNKDYFYYYKTLEPSTKQKRKVSKIMLLWDVSLSMKNRSIDKELSVLKNYVIHLNKVKITVRKFSNTLIEEKDFEINNGNSDKLQAYLKNSVYDGATSYQNILNFKKSYKECLLFTDGMDNLGIFNSVKRTPIYIINSLASANHNLLNNVALKSDGNYINLNILSQEQANNLLINETFRFLGVKQFNENELEIYPKRKINITTDFSISGKKFKDNEEIELLFGYGNKVTRRIKIKLQKSTNINNKIENIWAQKKLDHLVFNKEKNRNQIINLSKKQQLISPFTSLIVLDRVEDYVRYKIEPPKELQEEYKRLLAEQEDDFDTEEIEDLKKDLTAYYDAIKKWYAIDFKNEKPKKEKIKLVQNANSINTNNQISQENSRTNNEHINPNLRTINGIVSDDLGPISDISITVKGTNNSTVTDFDGNYSINASAGDVITFEHISYNSVEKIVEASNSIDVIMRSDNSTLDEVVVTGYAVRRKRQTTAYSVTTITTKEIITTPDISKTLAGKTSGVNITTTSGVAGANSNIVIRGTNSINSSSNPLYIIDGVLVENSNQISTTDIENISILKDASATALYGNRGANGIVIITTKKGLIENPKQIEAFNDLIEEKLALKGWNPNASYLDLIDKGKSTQEKYNIYINIRKNYANQPTFYLDVSDYFLDINERNIALKILSNIAEIEIENYELLRAIAYKFEALSEFSQALYIYKEILKIRPEDIQTYRDLALCYQSVGEHQKALDLLYKIVNGELLEKDLDRRFEGLEEVAFIEMNHLILKFKKKLNLSKINKKYLTNIKSDLRIVIDWNHNDTDIDLWVFDPNNEKCYYSHTKTKIGGKISEDMIEGFGPEEFLLKKAIKGKYEFKAKYYADNVQKISGPTILKVTVFTNYGMRNETKKIAVFTLDKEDEEVIKIGKLKI